MTLSTRAPVTVAEKLADFVGRRAASLAAGYQRDDSAAVATLARLRRAAGAGGALSADADLWDVFEGMPDDLIGSGDATGPAERAAIGALVLFALHQQSRSDAPMHVVGHRQSLGRSVGRLARATGSPGVERRFRAMMRAQDLAEATVHLRGLVAQLRGERIALDYGRLAIDMLQLQRPGGMQAVRMRWVRDYHRLDQPEIAPQDPATGDQS